jgi:hypothetical protein
MQVPVTASLTRRAFIETAMTGLAGCSTLAGRRAGAAEIAPERGFRIRGVVIIPENLSLKDWPERARRARLNTIALHHPSSPRKLLEFVQAEPGQDFLARCRKEHLHVEFDFHAMRDLVPRALFAKDPSWFRMNEGGARTPDQNFCVHSPAAMRTAVENALVFARALRPTTGRYYYWSDACAAWCRCSRCRELSDSDQVLLVENAILKALRSEQPDAQVAHLACHVTMTPPKQIRPEPGVFLQFAPARRRYDLPYSRQRSRDETDSLWYLERNLEVFPAAPAQALEYWLDVSLFSHGRRLPLPWDRDRVRADIATYRALGIEHIKSFANDLDAEYVRRNGEPTFLAEYGAALEDAFDR